MRGVVEVVITSQVEKDTSASVRLVAMVRRRTMPSRRSLFLLLGVCSLSATVQAQDSFDCSQVKVDGYEFDLSAVRFPPTPGLSLYI
jgi:hypothetical protein